MTGAEADKACEEVWDRLSRDTHQLADVIADSLNNPALPMLMRVAACARIAASAASGLLVVVAEEPAIAKQVKMVDTVPDIVVLLRGAADMLEEATKGLRN